MKSNGGKFPRSLPKVITFRERWCPHCNTELIYTKGRKTTKEKHCINCDKIVLITKELKITELEKEIQFLTQTLETDFESFKRKTILEYNLQFMDHLAKDFITKYSVTFHLMLDFLEFLEKSFKHSKSYSEGGDFKKYNELWQKYIEIKNLESLKNDLLHDIVFLGIDNTKYYSYKYLRRIDGLGEFGIGPKSSINKLLTDYSGEYQKEVKESPNINKDIFQSFQEDNPLAIEFFSAFYFSMQLTKANIEKLNLKWLKKHHINASELREWKLATFPTINTRISIPKTKMSLQKRFGSAYIDIYESLFSSVSRPKSFPYGIEIEGIARVSPIWAMFGDFLHFTELDGSIKLKKSIKEKGKDFEKGTTPEAFRKLGFEVVAGQKETENGNTIFEIDSYVWDKKDTLWVVESKSKALHKRFMESYDSWTKLCREWVERPKRKLSYPQILKIIQKNNINYQQNGIIPQRWVIQKVKGLIVSQIPPFEEEYQGIAILWYRELEEFFG